MAPEVELGRTAYHSLELLHVEFRELIFSKFSHIVRHLSEPPHIVSALGTLHIHKIYGGIHFLSNAFRASEDGSILIQKVHPVVNAVPLGRLVADETDDGRRALGLEFQHTAKGIILVDVKSLEACAQPIEKLIEHRVVQVLIKLSALAVDPRRQRRNPLPVAIMPQVEKHEGMVGELGPHLFYTLKAHTPHHLLLRNGEQLECFHAIVAQKMIETTLNGLALLLRLFGKGIGNVAAHNLAAIATHKRPRHVGKHIEHPKRKARQGASKKKKQALQKCFHGAKIVKPMETRPLTGSFLVPPASTTNRTRTG